MSLSEQDILLIEKYLSDSLEGTELETLKTRRKDAEFEEELLLRKKMTNASREIERETLKNTFKEWDESSSETKTARNRRFRIWPIAASALLLLGLGTIWYLSDKSASTDQIFATYYQPFDNLIDPISKNVDDDEASISQLYELGKYQSIMLAQVTDSLQAFYQILTLIELGKSPDAIPKLEQYSNEESFRFREAAQWYLALIYLKVNEPTQAKEVLDEIANTSGHDFRRLAQDIMEKIN